MCGLPNPSAICVCLTADKNFSPSQISIPKYVQVSDKVRKKVATLKLETRLNEKCYKTQFNVSRLTYTFFVSNLLFLR